MFGGMAQLNHLLTNHAAAHILGLTDRQLKALVRSSDVPRVELPNGETRFVEQDLWTWIEAHKQRAGGAVS